MRKKVQGSGLALQAVTGTYVVTLGWDITQESVKTGLLGFAIVYAAPGNDIRLAASFSP